MTVKKVGAALRDVTTVRKEYSQRFTDAQTEDQRDKLQTEATAVMVEAVRRRGLTVNEFNEVCQAADEDADLWGRLVAAAEAR